MGPTTAPPSARKVESEAGLGGFNSLPSLMQIRSVLFRAVPAVALLMGSLFYAFPRVGKIANKAGSVVVYTAGSSALTVVEKLAELPDWAWAMLLLLLAILYLLRFELGR